MKIIKHSRKNYQLVTRQNKNYLWILTVIFSSMLLGCNHGNASQNGHYSSKTYKGTSGAYQFGHLYLPNEHIHQKLQSVLKATQNKKTHFIQLGDSHTAADVFTGEVRELLQSEFGNGGIGFIQPTNVTGIRSSLLTISGDKNKFEILNSRSDQSPIFPLGGYLLDTKGHAGNVILSPRKTLSTNQKIQAKALYYTQAKSDISFNGKLVHLMSTNNKWMWSDEVKGLNLPITITFTKSKSLKLGGYYLENTQNNGVVFSALGINGAQINYWDRWHHSWKNSLKALKPDVILLAYGTNEAFGHNLDLSAYKQDLNERMITLKSSYPNTLFIVIGPPDSLKTTKKTMGACDGEYSEKLTHLINIQKELSLKNEFIFWNWQESMGGRCSIKNWLAQDLAKNDLVHLTSKGYSKSAIKFFTDLQKANSTVY